MKQEYLVIVLACILTSICFTSKQTIAQKSNENTQQQLKSKYTIGLQFNPYLSNSTLKRLFSGGLEKSYWVATLRFISTQSYQHNLSIGVEAMAFWTDNERYSGQFWNIGPLLKYEFLHYKRLTLFAETVPSINNSIITLGSIQIRCCSIIFVFIIKMSIAQLPLRSNFEISSFF